MIVTVATIYDEIVKTWLVLVRYGHVVQGTDELYDFEGIG